MEAASARAALRVAAQRILQACSALFRRIGTSDLAFARARRRIIRPPASDLSRQDHQARTGPATDQLRIGSLFSAPGLNKDDAINVRGARSRSPIAAKGRHQSGVYRQLRASVQGQATRTSHQRAS